MDASGYLEPNRTKGTLMIVILAVVIGAFLGWRRAGQLGGTRRDRLQYAAAFGMAFAVIGLFATVILDRII